MAAAAPADGMSELFVGRETEHDILRAALGHVRAGQPRVVLIEGPAGIGKTALVDRFIQLESDVQVLRASGEPWEALVPYGVIDQLTRGTGEWWRLLESEPALMHGITKTDRLIVFGGGVPLVADGRTVGGIGVSGGSSEQDVQIAEAGAAALC